MKRIHLCSLPTPEMSAGKARRRERQAPQKKGDSLETASEEGKVHQGRVPEEHRLGEGIPMRGEEDTTLEDLKNTSAK